jgi:hypothetical protein
MQAHKLLIVTTCFLLRYFNVTAQYAPAAGMPGSTAIYKDTSLFVNWASACMVKRGFLDISDPGAGYASAGDSTMATGKAQSNGVVSLGDGGSATCTFPLPVMNGTGYDFAVFENSFDDTFLELAHVEVSSDGINFFRFSSHSLTDTVTQTASFGSTQAVKLNNLAGKYRGGYGTPFDLQELANKPTLNVNAITHIRVRDVVGSLDNKYCSRDSYGNKINDPWPTAFPSGGFDLDAIGVIHENITASVSAIEKITSVAAYPNPVAAGENIHLKGDDIASVTLLSTNGSELCFSGNTISTSGLNKGIYFLKIISGNSVFIKKIVIL